MPARARCTLRGFACLLGTATALALSASAAEAETGSCTRVAAPSGSDSAPGTLAAPYRTVQELVDSLSAGETGCLRGGRYSEDVEIRSGGTSSAPLRVTAYRGEKATVVGEFEVHKGAPHVVVDHLYLNGRTAGRASPIVNAHDVAFRNDDVTNDHRGICFLLGDSNGVWGRADRAVIEYNRIHDCGRRPATNLDHGIYVEATSGALIQGNWIYDNADFGVHLYPDAQRTLVRGNVIDGNGMGVTFSGEGDQASSNNRVEGNVLANSRRRWNIESWWGGGTGRGNLARDNCLYAANRSSYYNADGGVTTESGGFAAGSNRVAAPSYENRSRADFRLTARSRCRAAFDGDPSAIPGPDGRIRATSRGPVVRLVSGSRSVRRGRRIRLRGKVSRFSGRPGRRVLVYASAARKPRLVARVRLSRTGRFALRPRVGTRARDLRFRAVVPRVGRSRAIRVRVRG